MIRPPHSPLRILQLDNDNAMGGVRTLMATIEAGLGARGFVVESMALRSGGGRLRAVGEMARVARAILSRRYDAIFTYQAASSVFGGVLGWLAGTRLRVVHHTAAPEAIRPRWRWLDRWLGSSGGFTHFVVNSTATADSFAAWPAAYRRRFLLIPHGVAPLPAASRTIDWRNRLGLAADELVLVATGRLVDQKNHRVAVEALARLKSGHLVIAGEGPNRAALEAQAKARGVGDRLHLIGAIDRQNLGDVLAAGDIYLFPSVWETFGLAGVEAALAGLPVIAADLPVMREVLGAGVADLPQAVLRLHAPHDAEGLADAIAAMWGAYPSADARAAFAERMRRAHGLDRMFDRYVALLTAGATAPSGTPRTVP